MRQMKAAVWDGGAQVRLVQKEVPVIEHPHEAIVKVSMAAICSSDLHILHGAVPEAKRGVTLGHEMVGTIVQCGSAVKRFAPGERVSVNVETSCGSCFYCRNGFVNNCSDPLGGWSLGRRIDGGQAEYVRVPYAEQGLNRIPEDVSDEAALFTGDLLSTGYWAAQISQIEAGQHVAVIGAGPAGLAAAEAAHKGGAGRILLLERDNTLGGILNQCIHNGFGLHTFKEELTGPEYAARFIAQAEELQIPYKLNTMVLDLAADKTVTAMNKTDGLFQLHPKAVILAMGCRERPRGALNIPGYRPAGIYTAGTAQRLVNMEGYLPGRKVVILGSGDIGLIMARRMTLEGAQVQVVAELMPYSGGLKRNIVQCLDDFGIPLKLSHTVVDIQGKERVEGITLARVENGKPVPGTEEHYDCDTLLLSCGLLPENELSRAAGVALSPITSGPLVNESLETSIPGVFAAGNVLHVHDLVDYVSQEAEKAGKYAALYIKGEIRNPSGEETVRLVAKNGVRYTVPQNLHPSQMEDTLTVRFRVGDIYKDCYIGIYLDDRQIARIRKNKLAPGEMEQVILKKKDVLSQMGHSQPGLKTITIQVERGEANGTA